MTRYDLGWLSALIDGEGCICLLKEKRPNQKAGCQYKPRLSIGNTNLPLIKKAYGLMGGYINIGKKGVYQLELSSNNMRWILPKIKLIAKEKQRLLAMRALDLLSCRHRGRSNPMTQSEIDEFENLYNKIRKLNGRVWNK